MKYRNAIFAVVYAITDDGNHQRVLHNSCDPTGSRRIEYAVLKRKKHWVGWEFTKGKIEKFEIKRRTARREVKEETGLKILNIKKFNISGKYKYKKELADRKGIAGQTYYLFAVKVKKGKIKVDRKEHSFGKWMTFKEAEKKLTWSNQKKCLRIVNRFVLNNL